VGLDLHLDEIQGNVVPGFSKDHQAFLFVRFDNAEQGRAWLRAVRLHVASATEVQAFREVFKSVTPEPMLVHAGGGPPNQLEATWVNLALSSAGLRLLTGPGSAVQFPALFRTNYVPGADPSAAPDGEVHALVIVAADCSSDLEAELHRQRAYLAANRITELLVLRGDTLPGDQRGHEHFGFKDAISQPAIAGTSWGTGPPVAAGEFILGYPDQTGRVSGTGLPPWTRNGSFLAFIQLQQRVAAFWSAMTQYAQQFGVGPEEVASWIVGRKPDAAGTLLGVQPSPLSHIGRGYVRWLPASESSRHRILRRGIPYGPPLPKGKPEDFAARGLLFAAYQADLERQFTHVWRRWLNGPDMPFAGAGRDALVGQESMQDAGWSGIPEKRPLPESPRPLRPALIPRPEGPFVVASLERFVTPLYGAYFFAPSISALSVLSGQF
jgi:Dyp-type peroxidase family